MAPTRFATPPLSFLAREPVTPVSGLRNRAGTNESQTTPGPDSSPTSEFSTMSNLSTRIAEPFHSLYRPISLTSAPASALGTPVRKVVIRADPAMLTCFDPSDDGLYNLWAPRS